MDPFRDNRHPYRHVSDAIIALFARHYTTLPAGLVTTEFPAQSELRAANEELRRANDQLEKINRERLDVIQEHQTAADERLGVIELLDAEINRLRGLL